MATLVILKNQVFYQYYYCPFLRKDEIETDFTKGTSFWMFLIIFVNFMKLIYQKIKSIKPF